MWPTLRTDAPLAHLRWEPAQGVDARTVLLLHGVGGGRESWGDAISGTGRAIAEAGFRAVAADLPGYGDSTPVNPYDLRHMAEAVRALIDWL
ncbi:MAG TPA: alpha/beta fold hydrolase, partial [Burkholderiaceae bacterium]|nr:alpha/beta fold hydrolase [Burkholderiaceae bacterium]